MANEYSDLHSSGAAVVTACSSLPEGITLRPFVNSDPPELVQIWNGSQLGRGAVRPLHLVEFDALVLAKLYFDREGLIVACDEGKPVGFVHAGFGADEKEQKQSRQWGVISAIMVLPAWRRRGIGRALLAAAERYLTHGGAEVIYSGGMRPLNPYYLGLYGGAELPGFLESDEAVGPFLTTCGYEAADRCLVFQRGFDTRLPMADWRFSGLRRQLQVHIDDASLRRASWWHATVSGLYDYRRLYLSSRATGQRVAEVSCWEMPSLGRTWGKRTMGLVDVQVSEAMRGQGVGKLLITELLVRLRDEGIELVEVQTMQRNKAAIGLYQGLGFEQVDQGVIYRRRSE